MDYLFFLQNCREGTLKWLNPVFFAISDAGIFIAIFVSFLIYWVLDKQAGKKIIAGLSLSSCITNVIKNIACIKRPWLRDLRLHVDPLAEKTATGYSFPSGHSTTSSSCYGGIAIWKKKNVLLFILLWMLVFAVMFSRNWLGCHTLTDVITGFAIGSGFMCISFLLFDKVESSLVSEIIFLVISLFFCGLFCIFFIFKKYPQPQVVNGIPDVDVTAMKAEGIKNIANFAGFVIGWFLERRLLKFEIPQGKKRKVIVALLGLVSTVILYVVICPLIFKGFNIRLKGFLKHFILFFWGTFGFPGVVSLLYRKDR